MIEKNTLDILVDLLDTVTYKKQSLVALHEMDAVNSVTNDPQYLIGDIRRIGSFIVGKDIEYHMLGVFDFATKKGSLLFINKNNKDHDYKLVGNLDDFKNIDINSALSIVHRGKDRLKSVIEILKTLGGSSNERNDLHNQGESTVDENLSVPVQEPKDDNCPVNNSGEVSTGIHNSDDDGVQLVDRETQKSEEFGILDRFQFMKYIKLSTLIKEYGFEKNSESQSIKVDKDKIDIGKGKPVFMRVTLKKQGRFSSLEITRSSEPESLFVFKRGDKKIRVTKKDEHFILTIKKTKEEVTDKVISAIEDFFKGGEPDEIVL